MLETRLSPTERKVFDFLTSIQPRLVDRFQIHRHLYGMPLDEPVSFKDSAIICVHISNMRKKMTRHKITNIYKYGYRLEALK